MAQQSCPFHVRKELPQGILSAVAAERNRVAKSTPQLKRGRPASKDQVARRLARQSKQIQEKIHGLCQDRFFLVTRRLKPSERQRLVHITRGVPQLRQLREIMEQMYALCDRRCQTPTARGKLKKVRQGVNRCTWMGDTFTKVFAPHLDKALTLLDDTVWPATSKAVERGNRRHRKRPKSVYRVRSQVC